MRAGSAAEGSEAAGEGPGADANGLAGLQAGVGILSPHQLRHGFANRLLRESGRDFVALQGLMGHSRPDTTQAYTDEVELDELADALDRAAASHTHKRRQI